jgi:hypothetical protein
MSRGSINARRIAQSAALRPVLRIISEILGDISPTIWYDELEFRFDDDAAFAFYDVCGEIFCEITKLSVGLDCNYNASQVKISKSAIRGIRSAIEMAVLIPDAEIKDWLDTIVPMHIVFQALQNGKGIQKEELAFLISLSSYSDYPITSNSLQRILNSDSEDFEKSILAELGTQRNHLEKGIMFGILFHQNEIEELRMNLHQIWLGDQS